MGLRRSSTTVEKLRRSDQQGRSVDFGVYAPQMKELFQSVKINHPNFDSSIITRAFEIAEYHHREQKRDSGQPYIVHPLAVAKIVADLGMTEPTIVGALLHDTIEDTQYSLKQLEQDFNPEIAAMVDAVTKLKRSQLGDRAKSETIRKIITAMFADVRAVVIKLADRVHNMQTIDSLSQPRQERIARETLDIFAPLAHRLGMESIKRELEDLSFATLEPKVYDQIVHQVSVEQPAREKILKDIIPVIEGSLGSNNVQAKVLGRPKHYYSIYQKMVIRGRDFTDIYDLLGLRVIVESTSDCYIALGTIHGLWKPVPGRFKDYIVNPRDSTYQSLHTTVIGPQGKPMEFQIRTKEMNRNAEYGVAAHWRYKSQTSTTGAVRHNPMDLLWMKRLRQWQSEDDDPRVFLENLTTELGGKDVMVFTPESDLFFLPQGSTPVDFAYAVHTEIGHACVGARINGKLVSLDTELVGGDVCEILTSSARDAGPSRDWLQFVKGSKTRQKINHYFSKENKDLYAEVGEQALAKSKQLKHSGLDLQKVLTVPYLTAAASKLRYTDIPSLYAAIGEGIVNTRQVVDQLVAIEGGQESALEASMKHRPFLTSTRPPVLTTASGVRVAGDEDVLVKLARCCTPVPGDEILGFVTRGRGVSVHRTQCKNVEDLRATPARILEVSWVKEARAHYLVTIVIDGLNRTGLLADVSSCLADNKVSIISANIQEGKDHTARMTLSFEIPDPKFLAQVTKKLKAIEQVSEVRRLNA
ncbi:MAG: bifunctional (p)ppGpp synthetase/guanosine-3',5'-bis(diphosphate) 3'-pyrophosphohydrolase [Propionibacteriaceae bacterium]|nr:bifunctional (p)ppGpp synthetase/guanosine-3',5'-bis(diphosphate) 3'-pyrophosphohydrolase [Propionibacteriaceae bacterium]